MKPEAVQLSPDLSGLTSAHAAVLLKQHGLNQMPAEREVPKWKRLLLELTHFFALMLWVAAALAFVAGLPELGVAIIVVVVVNGLFAYVQQEKAQHAAAKLRQLLPSEVTARRDGRNLRVHSTELVPGDVVILSSGDRVPADLSLAIVSGCAIDESMLTGESEPVDKLPGEPAWGGTFLINGQAEAIVSATGAATRLAVIAALAGNIVPPPSPLSLELRRIVRTVSVLALAVGSMFFAVSLAIGIAWRDAFLFAIGVCVALIPEGLLPTVTLSLAMGAQTMARRNALVRNLQAVETLGSTTFICTDKTGTLTQNRMNAVEVWTPAGLLKVTGEGYEPHAAVEGPGKEQALRLGLAARAASQGRAVIHEGRWRADGDPMEAAIDVLTRRLTPELPPEATPLARFAFDPQRRRESVIVGTTLFVKGAPEAVLPLCAQVSHHSDTPPPQGPTKGIPDLQAEAHRVIEEMAGRGLRVLAVAQRPLQETDRNWKGSLPEELEEELELLGLIGLHDPPRPGVAQALTAARAAGIKVAMITGDHPSTAASIAREIGLQGASGLVVEGINLPENDQELAEMIDEDGAVVSRVSPEQKLRIARVLQRRGHVVAMTGDGVNDGPALQEADIGVAMGMAGTDVAREAADLVLLDDDFATIIAAVEQGRATYANIRRFLTYHLTDNVAELTPFVIWALSGGQFPLALGVLQILFLDIGTDLLPALALGAEPPGKKILQRPPERRHLIDRSLMIRVFAVMGPVEALVEMTAFTVVLTAAGWHFGGEPPAASVLMGASGAAFTAVVLAQLANALACRSATAPPWKLGWTSNRLLLWSLAAELAALAAFLFVPPVAALLGHAPPPPAGLAMAALAIPAVFAADWTYKAARRGNFHS